jgi:hypothetical protein
MAEMRPSLFAADRDGSSRRASPQEGRRDGPRRISDVWRWLGMGGEASGTSGVARRSLARSYAVAAVGVGAICAIDFITVHREEPQYGLAAPIIWEGSSALTVLLFLWIPWLASRVAPVAAQPHWRLLIHIPAAVLFSLAHVTGFVALRKLVYWLAGAHYEFGPPLPNFLYELAKDAFGYALLIAAFAFVDHLLRQRARSETPGPAPIFDIRDGAKLTRVRLEQVLAVTSAGNYVEFVLDDGRRLLMRSPLSALESELGPRGFLRTHRSWLVNAGQMTALKPDGSGDYTVELGSLAAPLSRRFPDALAKLRGG